MSIDDYRKEFLRLFKTCCDHRRRKWDVFDDWSEVAALSSHQFPYFRGEIPMDSSVDPIEMELRRIEEKTDRETWVCYSQMVFLAIEAIHRYPCDFMATIFHDLELDDQGQSFTPWDVSRLMVRLQLQDLDLPALIAEEGVITVSDHACGAGGLLLSFAEFAKEKGIDPRTKVIFDAIDIDRRCFNMTYFQLQAANLMGDVHHGNTITWQFKEHRQTAFRTHFNLINREHQFQEALKKSMALMMGQEQKAKPHIRLRPIQLSLPV